MQHVSQKFPANSSAGRLTHRGYNAAMKPQTRHNLARDGHGNSACQQPTQLPLLLMSEGGHAFCRLALCMGLAVCSGRRLQL